MFFVLCGLCASVMWGNIFNLATSGLGKYTATASGFLHDEWCAVAAYRHFQGWIADKTDFWRAIGCYLPAWLTFYFSLCWFKECQQGYTNRIALI